MKNSSLRPLGLYDYRAYSANESFARALIRTMRWPDGVRCPRCNQRHIWSMSGDYRCGECGYHFSVLSGTIFQKSHLLISQWIIAIGLVKIGVNALGLQWSIGCNYITARRVLSLIRTVVANDPLLQQLQGEIEVDETYYGGRQKGKRGRGAVGKTAVLGFKERGGNVKTVVIPNITEETIVDTVERHVEKGSTVYSDGFPSYEGLPEAGYDHKPFDHSVHFVKDAVTHTQGIEGLFGHTKPITKARYRRITRKSLPGICAENDFRTNHRKHPDFIGLTLMQLIKFYPLSI